MSRYDKKLKYQFKNAQGELISGVFNGDNVSGSTQLNITDFNSISEKAKINATTKGKKRGFTEKEINVLREVLASKIQLDKDAPTKKLFYLNKITQERIEIPVNSEKMAQLDEALSDVYQKIEKNKIPQNLMQEDLDTIALHTDHTHESKEDKAQYCWVKLPYAAPNSDLRGLVLGDITDCCQSIGGDAEQSEK